MSNSAPLTGDEIRQIAETLSTARGEGRTLEAYPGTVPSTLAEAYQIQDLQIEASSDEIAGWKIGMVVPELREAMGAERIIGPAFKAITHFAKDGEEVVLPVFAGGFIAVEAEVVIELAQDIEPGSVNTADGVEHLVKAMYAGIEIASSPVPDLNSYGPAAIISDIGNNHGMIIGKEIENWQEALADMTVEVAINDEVINTAPANGIHKGQVGALEFLIDCCAERGITLKAGQMICSGATTGVHETLVGATSTVKFGDADTLNIKLVPIQG